MAFALGRFIALAQSDLFLAVVLVEFFVDSNNGTSGSGDTAIDRHVVHPLTFSQLLPKLADMGRRSRARCPSNVSARELFPPKLSPTTKSRKVTIDSTHILAHLAAFETCFWLLCRNFTLPKFIRKV